MKKTNNKGFSLVELIVVVAIMAVLMVVIAPQLLRHVENTRAQRDESAAAEFLHAVEIALADNDINDSLSDGDTVSAPDEAPFADGSADLLTELGIIFPAGQFDYVSNAHDGQTYEVTITKTADSSSVAGAWVATP